MNTGSGEWEQEAWNGMRQTKNFRSKLIPVVMRKIFRLEEKEVSLVRKHSLDETSLES